MSPLFLLHLVPLYLVLGRFDEVALHRKRNIMSVLEPKEKVALIKATPGPGMGLFNDGQGWSLLLDPHLKT